ncbi:uncharacterized protein LOC128198240 [Bicyclus anynana]|uniref:Uncharacterized protein LOC128198240 n=1 Tax=Bicyclus anynana TaxID=110368 RepID=A0ABM3LHE5_BICAN|nr:uncharacterized protein LOC128198240 [Bicyclus anynana]
MLLNMKVVVLLTFGMLFFKESSCLQQPQLSDLMRSMDELSDHLDALPLGNRRMLFGNLIKNIKDKIKEIFSKILGLSPPSSGSSGSGSNSNSQGSRGQSVMGRRQYKPEPNPDDDFDPNDIDVDMER